MELSGAALSALDRSLLSREERDRAGRFVIESDRRRYEISHVALRRILALYLPMAPGRLCFERGIDGKPSLGGESRLHFSLAHAGTSALIAIAADRAVGVDIEEHRAFDLEAVARVSFSSAELLAFQRLPGALRERAFFELWTRKEAYVKARGGGLRIDLRGFDAIGSQAVPHAPHPDAGDGEPWSLATLRCKVGYSAALAFQGIGMRVVSFNSTGGTRALHRARSMKTGGCRNPVERG